LSFDPATMMPPHFLIVLAAAVVLWAGAAASRRSSVPMPIVLVLSGVVLGFLPFVPDATLNPKIVLLGLLPLLVFNAAFSSSHRAFLTQAPQIGLLAVGLVIVTAGGVAFVAHQLAHLSWPMSFVLGTAVGPTDAVAVTSIARRLGLSGEQSTILNGEALFNDVTALVLYAAAVATATSGRFSATHTLGSIGYGVVVGVAIGLAVGVGAFLLRRRLDDPPIEIALLLLAAYCAYLPAQALGASGVLAAVVAGLYLGWHRSGSLSAQTRLQATAFWDTLVFLLDAALFILVGLSLHSFSPANRGPVPTLLLAGAAVAGAVVLLRLVWMALMFLLLRPFRRLGAGRQHPRDQVVIGWAGMRGAVTLAAVLAVPTTTTIGAPLRGRDDVIYLAFGVIFATLIGQGLTLQSVARHFNAGDNSASEENDRQARLELHRAALEHLEGEATARGNDEVTAVMRAAYASRIRRLEGAGGSDGGDAPALTNERDLRRELIDVERRQLLTLRAERRISMVTLFEIERDLDLEEARLR
jgi:CPA1 family monovalent cation:H+ antiporter